jgi:hypothetical protein
MAEEVYLGDGLYASFEGDTATLKLRAPREFGDHVVYLEPAMFQELLRFVRTHWELPR